MSSKVQCIIIISELIYKYLLKQKGLLLLVDQSLQLVGGQELLHLLRSHHGQKHLQEEE